MLQYLSATARRLRLDLALRARPAARAGRLAANMLAAAGPAFGELYANTNRRLAEQELRWIDHWNIDPRHFFDLMTLYPALSRAFFIHIPKCGGTSIRQQLVTGHGMAPVPLPSTGAIRQSIESMTAHSQYASQLTTCGAEHGNLRRHYLEVFAAFQVTANPKHLFVLGHQRAREIQPLYRQGSDLVFSTVRPPVDMLRSMVTYRVDHTLKNPGRPDSRELLAALHLDPDAFVRLVASHPRSAAERILAVNPPSLVSYLALGEQTDIESVWRGIREHPVFIADLSEQDQMLAALFGPAPAAGQKNTSQGRTGLSAEFAQGLRADWIEPFVEPDSAKLYQRLQSSGIIGFWQAGGTASGYRTLLANHQDD